MGPPVRRHVRTCERCAGFRKQLRQTNKALAAIFPIGPLLFLKKSLLAQLGTTASAGGAAPGAPRAAPPPAPPGGAAAPAPGGRAGGPHAGPRPGPPAGGPPRPGGGAPPRPAAARPPAALAPGGGGGTTPPPRGPPPRPPSAARPDRFPATPEPVVVATQAQPDAAVAVAPVHHKVRKAAAPATQP